MKRRLFTILSALSLLLCVAVVLSMAVKTDHFWIERENTLFYWRIVRGNLSLGWGPPAPIQPEKFTRYWIPRWLLISGLVVLPSLWGVLRCRSKSHRPGLCPSCGYDLRATPDRCPECGAVMGVQT